VGERQGAAGREREDAASSLETSAGLDADEEEDDDDT